MSNPIYAHFGSRVDRFWNMCTRLVHNFPNFLIYLYRNEPIEIVPGAWILLHMHTVCAQNISLISNTDA